MSPKRRKSSGNSKTPYIGLDLRRKDNFAFAASNSFAMLPNFFVGIDISKITLDIAVLNDGMLVQTRKIDNSVAALNHLVAALEKDYQCTRQNTIYCAEHMGIYGTYVQHVLHKKDIRLCLESPLQIKLSLGIQRLKNDTLDAIKIAEYARKNFESLRFWTPSRPNIEKLKTLASFRKKLIKMRGMFDNTHKIESHFLSQQTHKDVAAYKQLSYQAINQDLIGIEKEISSIMNADEHLNHLKKIITSIPYIGDVIATEMIILTNEFTTITFPKAFSSYCGIAPFARTSGTTLRGKPRFSHLANKEMKKLLHLASLGSAKKGQTKFHKYYARKVKEGKSKMTVLNAVRNKMVHVVFACIRDDKLYKK